MAHYSWDAAVSIIESRRAQQNELIRVMSLVRSRYNADYVLPMAPDSDDRSMPLVIANLVTDAIDTPAQQAASVSPGIFCPQVEPGKLTGVNSKEFADIRRRAMGATLYESKWELLSRKLFRHIGGYGVSALVLIQDDRSKMPRFVLRDPLACYPEPKAGEDLSPPLNVGFVFSYAASTLVSRWPQLLKGNGTNGPIDDRKPGWMNEMWDMLEWLDWEQTMIGVLGPSSRPATGQPWAQDAGASPVRATLLDTIPSKPGMPHCAPAVVPQMVTLDKIISRAAQMTGKMDVLAYLWDLDIQQTRKAISPDRYVVSRPNEQAAIISHGGDWQTGDTGRMNLISGAALVGELRSTPDPGVFQRMQALQGAAMAEAGLIGPQVGNTAGMAGALRTGRGIDALAGMSVDPRVQEMQIIAAEALHQLGPIVYSMYECYWPTQKYTMFTGWAGDQTMVSFTPEKHFAESKAVAFNYAIPGADASTITVGLAQLKGAGAIPLDEFRRLHPWISDADASARGVLIEALENMSLTALGARAAQGGIPPEDMAAITKYARGGMELDAAVIQANKDAQARQAQQAPPGAPEAQPGLGNPDEGAGAGGGAPPGPPSLADMAGALAGPPPPGGQEQFGTTIGPRSARLSTVQPA